MKDPELQNIELDYYKSWWKEISKKFDEYIDIKYKDHAIIDVGSSFDIYMYVLDELIKNEKLQYQYTHPFNKHLFVM